MEKGDTFKLDAKWWRDNQPKLLKSSGLGKALDAFAKAEAALGKEVNANKAALGIFSDKPYTAFVAMDAALEDVDKKRLVTIKNCGKVHKDCAEALKKDKVIDDRRKLMRKLMAKRIGEDAEELLRILGDDLAMLKKIRGDMSNMDKIRPLAEQGNAKALSRLETGVSSISVGIGKIQPDNIKGNALDLHALITKLPGDFSGHAKSMAVISKQALQMMKETPGLTQWVREYQQFDKDVRKMGNV